MNLLGEIFIGFIVLYVFMIFLVIVGNFFVIVVFIRGKRLRMDLCYFFINLVIVDLLMGLFCMFFIFVDVIYNMWIFFEFVCFIVLFI